MKLRKKIKRFYEWYIKGYYHCDHCRYAWEERGYEGDCIDCGCHIKGEIQDTCRLLPPFKNIIGAIRIRQNEYAADHEYDSFGEWAEKRQQKSQEFNRLLADFLKGYELCCTDDAGQIIKDKNDQIFIANKETHIESEAWRVWTAFEDFITPPSKPLRTRWAELMKLTWMRFIRPILPFLPKRKNRGKKKK